VASLAAPAAACSSSNDTPDAAAPDAGPSDADAVGCVNDKRADTYTANLAKAGKAQKVNATLTADDPAPPARGLNHWTVRLTDATGAPVTGALTVKPYMPDHGHPSSTQPVVTSKGDGTYDIAAINLFMPGLWQVTLSTDGPSADDVVYSFCIQG